MHGLKYLLRLFTNINDIPYIHFIIFWPLQKAYSSVSNFQLKSIFHYPRFFSLVLSNDEKMRWLLEAGETVLGYEKDHYLIPAKVFQSDKMKMKHNKSIRRSSKLT